MKNNIFTNYKNKSTMKKLILIATVLFISVPIFSQDKDFSLAKVGQKIMGVYIFIGCEPANEYDYIATLDVRWNVGNPSQSFLEIIERGKKKYPNFDGVIFKNAQFERADLIKFRGLELSGGGFRIGDYAVYDANGKPRYAEIVQLDNPKQKAGFKYIDDYGEEKLSTVPYSKLSIISKEQYVKLSEQQNIDVQKHRFTIGEKVTWTAGKNSIYGEVSSLNPNSHFASVKALNKYGEDVNTTIDLLDLEKLEVSKFQEYRQKELAEIKIHQFETGQKVSFILDKKAKCGEVVSLNNRDHSATIKYLGLFAEDKTLERGYFDMEKISEEKFTEEIATYKREAAKYKFEVGEKVIWEKGTKTEPVNAEILSLNDLEHKAIIKYLNKDNAAKQESVSYLNLAKIK
jgi:hypothetical protein